MTSPITYLADTNVAARRVLTADPLHPESPWIYLHWRKLVEDFDVRGRQVYDARLVAVMRASGVTHVLTTNGSSLESFRTLLE